MPDAIITSTESTFGTISGTFLDTGATVSGTVSGVVAGTLDGSVGVPGPQGPAGSQGPAGPQGQQGNPGVGVPTGGTAGQVLAKVDGVDYNTQWVNDSGAVVWGDITGTLSDQTDLQTALDAKLNWFGGSLVSGYLEGCQVVSTPPLADNTHTVADTAFVQQELASGTAVAKNLEVYVRNQTGATLTAGTIVYINGATGNRPTVTKAQANNDANSAQTFGFVKTSIANNGFGYVIVRGELENVDTSGLTEGAQLYLSPTTAGTWTTTKPSAPQHLVYVGIVVRSHPTQGVILVAVQNGYELDELHDVQIVSPTNGQVLKYDSATGLWKNATDLNSGVWGSITGTLSSQTDLQTALDGKYSTTNPAGYITSSALSPYLLSSTAASTYYLQSNPAGYITSGALTPYLTIVDAESSFYPLTGNPSGFITSSALTDYATESWVTAGFYPLTGNPSGFITSSALTPYLTSATAASTYQTLAGMSSYLTTSAAASTYLTQSNAATTYYPLSSNPAGYLTSAPVTSVAGKTGAVSLVVADVSGAAPLASPALSGTPTAPTAANGTNTTQIATTAFVLANAGSTSFATNAQVVAGTSTTTALYPGHSGFLKADPRLQSLAFINSTSLSGSGMAGTNTPQAFTRQVYFNSLAIGRASFNFGVQGAPNAGFGTSTTKADQVDFSKKVWISGYAMIGHGGATSYLGDANTVARITLGGYNNATASGEMTMRGIGLKKVGGLSSFVTLTVHNGTTRTDVASSVTCPDGGGINWMIYSDGTGNVTLYINGVQAATTSAGPTSATASGAGCYREQIEALTTPGVRYVMNCNGGWFFSE